MKKISSFASSYQSNENLIDNKIFDDVDIVKFMNDNNLTISNLYMSQADIKEYLKNKGMYTLVWNGMLELHITKKRINPGITYLSTRNFSYDISLNNIKGLEESEKKKAIEKCMELRNNGFYLYGKNGVGKTFFSVALANERYKSINKKTLFVFWPEFIQNMKKFERDSYQMLQKVKRCNYLIIDDLGQETISSWSRDDILNPIITFRLENKLNTIITSNYEVNELYKLYTFTPIESKKVKSIFIKMETLSKPVKINGIDLRKDS